MRKDRRAPDALRPVSISRRFTKWAPGSVLVSVGDTRVICAATFEEKAPPWLRGKGRGWITAEYALLPSATQPRTSRDNAQKGRAQEISRLIGRALRAVTNLRAMGECMVLLDCDVIQADGGTRAAAITGAYVALHDAFRLSVESGYLQESPLRAACAAVSVGIVGGEPMLDLTYAEDAEAEVDMNVVMDDKGGLIEIQGTAENAPFSRKALSTLLDLGEQGIRELLRLQETVIAHE